jgi:hypothetical protein
MSRVRLTGSTSGYVEITAPAIAGNNTVTLPSSNGSADQLLKNGATPGTLEYSTVSIGSTGELDNIASINGGPLAGFRNRIINSNFDFWQRGTSFTAAEYGADRWFHARTGSTHTVTRQAFTVGQTDVPNEPTYFCRTVVSSVAGASNNALLAQRIEDVRTFAGQQVTVSFWAKVDSTKNIALDLIQNFGTGGSPSTVVTAIGATKVSIGTSWQKVTVTATMPSISGKTLGSDNNSYVQLLIWFDAGSDFNSRTDSLGQQSGTFEIAQVQIEPGSVATPFERRPIGTELALCQRYAYVNQQGDTGRAESTAKTNNSVKFPVTMRTAPSAAVLGTLKYRDNSGTTTRTASSPSAPSLSPSTPDGAYYELTASSWSPSNFTIGNLTHICCDAGANGILFSAEL